ncbi:MAG: superinfection immunity protein [Acidobacteriaceae bacterium]
MRESEECFALHEHGEEPAMLSAFVALGTLGGFAFTLALYFLPALVAKSRHHPNTSAIFMVNLFFGWTFLGWVICFIWACTRPAAPVLYAPVYPVITAPPQHMAVANPAVTILPPSSSYRGAR